jgi:dihydrodipicolinate synthase/N-acetylneuraminate lyase
MDHGATGAVSGLGTAFPEVIAELVHERSTTAQEEVSRLREELEGIPFHAAMKTILGGRGVPVSEDVRAPLRGLRPDERDRVLKILEWSRLPSRQQSLS